MAKIAVIHRTLGVGGGESVCFHILNALQYQYDVHLYALNQPDFDRLNEAFGTDVRDVTVHTPATLNKGIRLVDTIGKKLSWGKAGVQTGLELVALSRRYSRQWEEFDLRISTHGELPLSSPAIQYLHHPFLNRWKGGGYFEIQNQPGKALNRVYTALGGANREVVRQSELLTNSEWTADQIEALYGERPGVVYPPINIARFDGVPWERRENGFVSVGRVSKDKYTHRAVDILKRVRDRGYDVHLHLIGEIDTGTAYGRRIRRTAEGHDWVIIEGQLPQEDLFKLIETHQWGLHTKPFEHFGMAVAEQVAGGAIPFVPNSGGQIEIVGRNSELCYDSNTDAAAKISNCLSNPELAENIQSRLPDIQNRFGKDRFKNEITDRVKLAI